MGAIQKFQLLVESQTRGNESLKEMEAALSRISEATAKANRTAITMAAGIAGTVAAFKAGTAALIGFADANLRVEVSSQKALAAYRALRLTVAATGGTASIGLAAGTVAAGYALQKVIETTLERARQVQAASFKAARSGSSFESAYTMQAAGAVTGRDLGFLSGFTAKDVSELTVQLRAIDDPVIRAQTAIRLFGKDGEQALKVLDGRLVAATERASDLALELDGPTRAALNRFESAWSNMHPFQQIGDEFDFFAESMKIKIAGLALDGMRAFDQMAQSMPTGSLNGPGGDAQSSGFNPDMIEVRGGSRSSFGDVSGSAMRNAFIRDARERAEARLAEIPIPKQFNPALISAAGAVSGRLEGGREGVEASLAAAIAKRDLVLRSFNSAEQAEKGQFAESLLQNNKRVETLQAQLKSIDAGLKSVEERAALIRSLPDLMRKSELAGMPTIARIQGERSDLGAKLGPGFDYQLNAIFGPRQRDEMVRLKADAVDSLGKIETARMDLAREIDQQREESAREFSQRLGKTISAQEKEMAPILQRLDIAASSDAGKLTLAAQGRARTIGLLAGPGDEKAVAGAELQIRLSLAKDLLEISARRAQLEKDQGEQLIALDRARAELAKSDGEARLDYELRILDLARQRKDEARGLASDFTASLQAGDPGGFFRQQGSRLVNQVGTNLFTGTFQRAQGVLGKIGEASGMGSLFKGSLLDPANATPLDKTAAATERTAIAAERTANAVEGRSFTGGTGTAATLPSGFNAIAALGPASGLFGSTASGKIAQITDGAASALTPSGLFAGVRGGSISLGNGQATTREGLGLTTTAARTANVAGSAASIGVGALTAYRAFKEGGVSGISQGITAALGTAALIPGPQQPFIAAAAATAALVSMLLPDPKKARDAQINRQLDAAYYEDPTSMGFNFDRFGRGYDSNKRGDMRPIIIQNFDLIDGSGIMDRREFFADAVRQASYEGHGINRAMQEAVVPA